MSRRTWVYDPHRGGKAIPQAVRDATERRIQTFAAKRYAARFLRLAVRFKGALCYIDAFTEPHEPSRAQLRALRETRAEYLARLRAVPVHLCRLRYFGDENAWSLAFYTYSHERYEPSVFPDGRFHGTPEEGFEVGATFLLAE